MTKYLCTQRQSVSKQSLVDTKRKSNLVANMPFYSVLIISTLPHEKKFFPFLPSRAIRQVLLKKNNVYAISVMRLRWCSHEKTRTGPSFTLG